MQKDLRSHDYNMHNFTYEFEYRKISLIVNVMQMTKKKLYRY